MGNRIRIGGSIYGLGSEIDDPTGAIWALLERMDGRTRIPDIVDGVIARHPGQDREAVLGALTQVIDAGFAEDVDAADSDELTDRDKERYDRSRRFYRWVDLEPRSRKWHSQIRLRNARVVVVGLGGTGGSAALSLAASGIGRLHCVDYDLVELSNLNRQVLYTEKDIGRTKVDAAVDRLRQLNSDIEITGQQSRITSQADFVPLVADCDVLLLSADQPGEIRAWANRCCLSTGTPWVDSGYHGPRASVGVYVPGRGACYECGWMAYLEHENELGNSREYTTARKSRNAVCAPSAGLSGFLASYAVIALITGVSPVAPGVVYGVNLVAPDDEYVINNVRNGNCPACGAQNCPPSE
jgi:molybdopterin/thiamine biosynthesis adenylyltransferase